ncbi:MAG TPA: dolichyl-phosphate beta-glucosyltransferase [Patescibacteria group bacterium]
MKYDLSVVIPTYNEADKIENTVKSVFDYLKSKNIRGEVIISDDCSTDNTVGLVEKLQTKNSDLKLVKSEKNYFKGWPVKNGMLKADGKIVLFADADLATPIKEADKLLDAIDRGSDIAIGSRIHESFDLRSSQPFYRRILGKMFAKLKSFLIPQIKDSQTGFKMFKGEVAKVLFEKQKIKNIIFDVEILYMAKKLKYNIAQVPVDWNYGGQTRMKISAKNAISTIISLVKIWFYHKSLK